MVDELALCQRLLGLSESRGMPMVQVNGQRLTGPPTSWSGPPPPPGCEVFAGGLPRDVFEDDLMPFFESAGSVYLMRLMMDFSGSNRGFAFVQYGNAEDADRAITLLNRREVRPGKSVGVVKSVENCRLYVGNIPHDKTREEVQDDLERRVAGISRVFLYPDPDDRSRNRGYAFVEFESHRAAAMARRELLPGRSLLWGRKPHIDWALPEPVVDASVMKKVSNLYINNLSALTTEHAIQEACECVSGPESIIKVKKIKDFAFVHFHRREDAEKVLEYLNGRELDGSAVGVTWAKPANRLQHVKDKHSQRAREMGLNTPTRTTVSDSNCRGRPLVKTAPPESFDWFQPMSSMNGSAVFLPNLMENFPYSATPHFPPSAAPHFTPFTMPDYCHYCV